MNNPKPGLKEYYMRLALVEARKNLVSTSGGPFGACIVLRDTVVAVARNTVLKHDATAHAEINAIRAASRKLKTWDLSGCHIYSTTEPCPMCFGALHWARISVLIYGTSIADVKKRGFHELNISNARLKTLGKSPISIFSGCLRQECLELLVAWDHSLVKRVY
ncbi:MAG: nucleoside deaminase [Candidatus Omnitrophota bacterium]|jgi:tRNA(Arg) A34 adenosine deaminase TadA